MPQPGEHREARLRLVDGRLEGPGRSIELDRHERPAGGSVRLGKPQRAGIDPRLAHYGAQLGDLLPRLMQEGLRGPQLRRLEGKDRRCDARQALVEGEPRSAKRARRGGLLARRTGAERLAHLEAHAAVRDRRRLDGQGREGVGAAGRLRQGRQIESRPACPRGARPDLVDEARQHRLTRLQTGLATDQLGHAALDPLLLHELLRRKALETPPHDADLLLVGGLHGGLPGENARFENIAVEQAPGRSGGEGDGGCEDGSGADQRPPVHDDQARAAFGGESARGGSF